MRPAASDKNKRAHLLSARLQSASPLLQYFFINDDVVSADVMESKSLPLPPDEGTTAPSSPSALRLDAILCTCVCVPLCVLTCHSNTEKWSALAGHPFPSDRTSKLETLWPTRRPRCPIQYQGMPRPPHCLILPCEARTDCNASSYLSPPQFLSI